MNENNPHKKVQTLIFNAYICLDLGN